ncbi:MAG: M14 family metallopeptidase [Anaerolineales bacterium]
MARIPASYTESRERFRAWLEPIRRAWPDAQLETRPLPGHPTLTTDWISAVPTEHRERLLVLSTGLHGIEGYVGAAVLDVFFEEFLPRLDPRTSGLLIIHAINPWGMQHRKRTNPHNVDLNRNFIRGSFDALENFNPDYPLLSRFLNPAGPVRSIPLTRLKFAAQAIAMIARYGVPRIREAALMGQYRQPEGIYYGGADLQDETKMMMTLYAAAYSGYTQIVHLDMHTGYGPRNQMTLVASPLEARSAADLMRDYRLPLVAAATPEAFYTMQGDMTDWQYHLVREKFPQMRFFGAAFEFGTFGDSLLAGVRSLLITVLKNQVNLYGADPASAAWIEQEYGELYCPSDPRWLDKALHDARQAYEGILGAEGFLA